VAFRASVVGLLANVVLVVGGLLAYVVLAEGLELDFSVDTLFCSSKKRMKVKF